MRSIYQKRAEADLADHRRAAFQFGCSEFYRIQVDDPGEGVLLEDDRLDLRVCRPSFRHHFIYSTVREEGCFLRRGARARRAHCGAPFDRDLLGTRLYHYARQSLFTRSLGVYLPYRQRAPARVSVLSFGARML